MMSVVKSALKPGDIANVAGTDLSLKNWKRTINSSFWKQPTLAYVTVCPRKSRQRSRINAHHRSQTLICCQVSLLLFSDKSQVNGTIQVDPDEIVEVTVEEVLDAVKKIAGKNCRHRGHLE